MSAVGPIDEIAAQRACDFGGEIVEVLAQLDENDRLGDQPVAAFLVIGCRNGDGAHGANIRASLAFPQDRFSGGPSKKVCPFHL